MPYGVQDVAGTDWCSLISNSYFIKSRISIKSNKFSNILGQGQQAIANILTADPTGLLPRPPPSFPQNSECLQFYVWKSVAATFTLGYEEAKVIQPQTELHTEQIQDETTGVM